MSKDEMELVCEALVREIGSATRWSAVREAWFALLHVRHMWKQIHGERDHSAGSNSMKEPS